MMKQFDLYGFKDLNIEEARLFIEERLEIQFTMRDSSYRGLYYVAGKNGMQKFSLESNHAGARWYKEYPTQLVTLMISLPELYVKEKLTSDNERAVFLRSIIVNGD